MGSLFHYGLIILYNTNFFTTFVYYFWNIQLIMTIIKHSKNFLKLKVVLARLLQQLAGYQDFVGLVTFRNRSKVASVIKQQGNINNLKLSLCQ